MDATTRPYHDPQAELRALFLASYMACTGWDADEAIMPLFARMPDYSAAETRKQVGGIVARGYRPMGCRRLKAACMCPAGVCGVGCGRASPLHCT